MNAIPRHLKEQLDADAVPENVQQKWYELMLKAAEGRPGAYDLMLKATALIEPYALRADAEKN